MDSLGHCRKHEIPDREQAQGGPKLSQILRNERNTGLEQHAFPDLSHTRHTIHLLRYIHHSLRLYAGRLQLARHRDQSARIRQCVQSIARDLVDTLEASDVHEDVEIGQKALHEVAHAVLAHDR